MFVGVTVKKGDSEYDIYAKSIVSNAGAYNTYGRLIPQELSTKLGKLNILLLYIIFIRN